MSELKNKKLEYEEYPIDVNSSPYRDPVREKARQERLKKEAEAKQAKQDSPKAGKLSRRNEKRDHTEEEKEKKKKDSNFSIDIRFSFSTKIAKKVYKP